MSTTLLIPCYNEEAGIPQLCDRLRPLVQVLGGDGATEVLFVDDGSTDGTVEAINRGAIGLPFRIVSHDHNRGLGAALRTGFAASMGEEVVTLDSDCTYDPGQAVELLRTLRQGFDVVTGSPYHPVGEVVGVEGWRLFLSKGLSRVYWLILPQRLYTYTSCFRAYRRGILPTLVMKDDGFLGVTQILVSAILGGFKVSEVPARLTRRKFGQSKIKIVRVVISHIRYIFYVIFLRMSHRVQNVA
jgi:dolichol-phosphate mannosyltransferase